MRAIRAHEFGSADVLRLDEIAAPAVGEGDILVRVVASGVNPIEWKIRSGAMARALGRPLPATFGWECAGIVISVGSSVSTFKAGDAVFSYPEFTRGGTHADQVAIAADQAARKPRTLDFAAAAAVPMTAQAAWTALDAAVIEPGERVLVHGAGGAVGHWLVQLAKLRGAEVIATASGKQLGTVAALGARKVIDYREQRFEDIGPVAVVFDLVGGETQERSWAMLGDGGRLVSTVSPPAPQRNGAKGTFVFTPPRGALLAQIATLLDKGTLSPLSIGSTMSFTQAAQAHALGEAGKLLGKAVLTVSES
jgi:NADPH:quinone reductase-like Zn-dependent oxidoreductase